MLFSLAQTLLIKHQSQIYNLIVFLLAPMGVLTPGSAHARPSAQPPIDTSVRRPGSEDPHWVEWNFVVQHIFIITVKVPGNLRKYTYT